MVAIPAEIQSDAEVGEKRRLPRRTLRLVADARAVDGGTSATIYNLSRTGMLLESPLNLAVNESIAIELPEAGVVSARVVWSREGLAGCAFRDSISRAALSAALLRALPEPSPFTLAPALHADPFEDQASRKQSGGDMLAIVALCVLAVLVLMLLSALWFSPSIS